VICCQPAPPPAAKKGPDAEAPGPRANAVFAPPNRRQRVGGGDARGGSDQRTQPLYLIRDVVQKKAAAVKPGRPKSDAMRRSISRTGKLWPPCISPPSPPAEKATAREDQAWQAPAPTQFGSLRSNLRSRSASPKRLPARYVVGPLSKSRLGGRDCRRAGRAHLRSKSPQRPPQKFCKNKNPS
jgi:hypothetical protein